MCNKIVFIFIRLAKNVTHMTIFPGKYYFDAAFQTSIHRGFNYKRNTTAAARRQNEILMDIAGRHIVAE